MAASACFTDRNIRWMIHSFVNDYEQQQQKLSVVLKDMATKILFKKEILPRLKKDARKVVYCEYNKTGCLNCYYYGRDNSYTSLPDERHYVCMSHEGEEPNYWMSFQEYTSFHGEDQDFEEFEEEDKEMILYRRERIDDIYRRIDLLTN